MADRFELFAFARLSINDNSKRSLSLPPEFSYQRFHTRSELQFTYSVYFVEKSTFSVHRSNVVLTMNEYVNENNTYCGATALTPVIQRRKNPAAVLLIVRFSRFKSKITRSIEYEG